MTFLRKLLLQKLLEVTCWKWEKRIVDIEKTLFLEFLGKRSSKLFIIFHWYQQCVTVHYGSKRERSKTSLTKSKLMAQATV